MSKTSNVAAGVGIGVIAVMFGFGTLLGVVVGIAALSNGIVALGLIALAIGIVCAGVGYNRIRQVLQAAKNVNARQAARAAQAAPVRQSAQNVVVTSGRLVAVDDTQPIPVQSALAEDDTKGNAPRDDGKTPLT